MQSNAQTKGFANTCVFTVLLSVFLVAAALSIYFLLPNDSKPIVTEPNASILASIPEEYEEERLQAFQDRFAEVSLSNMIRSSDEGLTLYRQTLSKPSVEWFYTQITGNHDVAMAILTEADKNEIPLTLAFALAHTESNYRATAINKNSNTTIDRGLFQLNSNTFPTLSESEFFDPYVSARYGMSHLKFCLNTAGNEVSALAMYNAGTGRVRSNKTPQSTLNYVGKIMSYQKMLDQMFAEQVVSYYESQLMPTYTIAYAR